MNTNESILILLITRREVISIVRFVAYCLYGRYGDCHSL